MSYYTTNMHRIDYSGSEPYTYQLNPLRPIYTQLRRDLVTINKELCACLVKVPNITTYPDHPTKSDAYFVLYFNKNLSEETIKATCSYKKVDGFY